MPAEPLTAVPGTSVPTGSLISPGGEQGVSGAPGPQGPQGPTGPQGIPGADSTVPGPQGPAGPTGPTGAAGTTGATGAQGPQGLPGNDGAPGATGAQGPKGDPGTTGATGAQGPQGTKGDPGSTGQTGAQGPKGDPGPQGIQGVKGDTGTPGSTGATGAPGTPGEQWFSGSGAPSTALGVLNDWYLNSANGDFYEKTAASTWTLRGNLKGPQGAQGAQGIQGNTGATGSQGPQGIQGNPGATGATGSQGPAGPGVPAGGTANQYLRKKSSTNYDTEWETPATLQTARKDTAATSCGLSVRMAGMGGLITPTATGKILVQVGGMVQVQENFIVMELRYGTGTPPANNAVASGTIVGWGNQTTVVGQQGFSLAAVIADLAVGTTYWLDVSIYKPQGTLSTPCYGTCITAVELP